MRIKNFEDLQKMRIGKKAFTQISSVLLKPEEKKSKYSNVKTERFFNGKTIVFDSIKEANYFDKLYLELKAGIIKNLEFQPKFDIIPTIVYENKTYKKILYIADFSFFRNEVFYVVDVKGFRTDVYKIKKRLFLLQNPGVKFIEV